MRRRKPLRSKKQLRSLKQLQSGSPLERRTPLKAGKPMARTELKRGTSELRRTELKRGPWNRNEWEKWTALDEKAHGQWKGLIVRRRCEMCLWRGRAADARGVRDPHHILPARYIRRYVRGLRLPSAEAKTLLRSLMYDKRNGMSLCRKCHEDHESAFRRVAREAIPPKAWQFARELELEHVLDRLYPAAAI